MLDFTPVRTKQLSMFDLTASLSPDDLRSLTHEMVDTLLGLIADCSDVDVVFEPLDPEAHDLAAENPEDSDLAWTLGHVIVHTTASAEEYAFLSAELARGVEWHGRSRYEVDWKTVTTLAQCRQRLEESRRMRIATLDIWPENPHYENTYSPATGFIHNCRSRFASGLMHDDSHLAQIAEIIRQAQAARS
jgi:hypothetical protein